MFNYCIWLLPDINSSLYQLTKGFRPHISLATNLTRSEAFEIYENINKVSINIKLSKKNETNNMKGFYSYYHFIKNIIFHLFMIINQ